MGKLRDILPPGYEYSGKLLDVERTESRLPTPFRMKLSSKNEVQKWRKKLEEKSLTTWRVDKTFPKSTEYYHFKADYRCHHNTHGRVLGARTSKNTNCPAKLKITVERYDENVENYYCCPVDDPGSREWPCLVQFHNHHNHPLQSDSILKFRDMSEETKQKLRDLFARGHSPTSALHCLKTDLMLEHLEDYSQYDGDGHYVPSLSKCGHLFNKEFKQQRASRSGEQMLKHLEHLLKEYSSKTGGKAIAGKTDDGHVYVCICTPLMARVHNTIERSSEIMFVDVVGYNDPKLHRAYFMTTSTPAGFLPLAIIITDVKKETVFGHALKELFQHCLPEESFFGQKYPTVIIIDRPNDLKKREPLQSHFADSTLLICQFHILKAMWAWLSNTVKHGIENGDRRELYFLYKELVYSNSEEDLQRAFNTLNDSKVAKKYPQYIGYVEKSWHEKEAWATCYRSGLPIWGGNATNYRYAEDRISEDLVFQRVKSFNMTHLVDFLLNSYEAHIQRRLLTFANDGLQNSFLARFLSNKGTVPLDEIKEHGTRSGCYLVPSETKQNVTYTVDIDACICECCDGNTGTVCKHFCAVFRKRNGDSNSMARDSTLLTRKRMFQVAKGEESGDDCLQASEPNVEWQLPLISEVTSQQGVPQLQQQEVQPASSLWGPVCQVPEVKDSIGGWIVFLGPTSGVPSQQTLPQLKQPTEIEATPPVTLDPTVSVELQAKLKTLFDRIMQCAEANPNVFVPAIRKMCKNAKKLASTETGLASSLNAFGEYSATQLPTKNHVAGVKRKIAPIAPRETTPKVICLPAHGMARF